MIIVIPMDRLLIIVISLDRKKYQLTSFKFYKSMNYKTLTEDNCFDLYINMFKKNHLKVYQESS